MYVVDRSVGELDVEYTVNEYLAILPQLVRCFDALRFADIGDQLGSLDRSFVGSGVEILVAILQVGSLITTTVIPYDHPTVINLLGLNGHDELIGIITECSRFLTRPTAAHLHGRTGSGMPYIAVDRIAEVGGFGEEHRPFRSVRQTGCDRIDRVLPAGITRIVRQLHLRAIPCRVRDIPCRSGIDILPILPDLTGRRCLGRRKDVDAQVSFTGTGCRQCSVRHVLGVSRDAIGIGAVGDIGERRITADAYQRIAIGVSSV